MSKKNRNQNKAQAETLESTETETKEFYPGTSVEMTETTLEELEEPGICTVQGCSGANLSQGYMIRFSLVPHYPLWVTRRHASRPLALCSRKHCAS